MGCAHTRQRMARPKLCATMPRAHTRGRLPPSLRSSCAPEWKAHRLRVCSTCSLMRMHAMHARMHAVHMDTLSYITAELGSKNGVPARTYRFQMVKASTTSGKYSDIMINDCKKIGMKPVCDHPSYCKTDKNAVYIGQSHHLAHGGHRGTSSCAAASLVCAPGACSATGAGHGCAR